MDQNDRRLRVRDGYGAMASALVTLVVFGTGPMCALLWFLGGAAPVELLAPPPGLDGPPVEIRYSALTLDVDSLDDFDGEGGIEDGELMAGPDPTVGSDGDGSTDAIVDAGGDEGEDDETQTADMEVDGSAVNARRQALNRVARGLRTPGAQGYSEEALRARAGVRQRRGRNRCKDSHPDVTADSEDRWTVNRNLVDWYTKSFKRFNSLGWSGPYENDDYKGWKIGGFGCNSPLHFAGLRRGDIVLTVNDKPTRNWLQIFGMYNKLRRKDRFEVVVIRRGKRKVLNYTLVDGGPPTTG